MQVNNDLNVIMDYKFSPICKNAEHPLQHLCCLNYHLVDKSEYKPVDNLPLMIEISTQNEDIVLSKLIIKAKVNEISKPYVIEKSSFSKDIFFTDRHITLSDKYLESIRNYFRYNHRKYIDSYINLDFSITGKYIGDSSNIDNITYGLKVTSK